MFKLARLEKCDINQKELFKEKLILENSRRSVILLGVVATLQIIFLFLELIGVLKWDVRTFIIRLFVFIVCGVFSFLLSIYKRNSKNEKSIKRLGILTTMLYYFSLVAGVYFTINLLPEGEISYTVFFITALFMSLSYIQSPHISNISLLLTFALLIVHDFFTVDFSDHKIFEIFNSIVMILIICVGNIMNYHRHWNLVAQDIKITEINSRLKRLSEIDEVTGVYNRRRVTEILGMQMEFVKRYEGFLSVVLLDLDYFKHVNDTYGHNVGDIVLKEFAEQVKAILRVSDLFGRWGGEEFIIVANTSKEDTLVFIERLRMYIEQHNFADVCKITFSAGVSAYKPNMDMQDVIDDADKALYKAKSTGRNRVCVCGND